LFLAGPRRNVMGHATTVLPAAVATSETSSRPPAVRFLSLVAVERSSTAGRKSSTFIISLVLHTALVAAVAILPLLYYDSIPEAGTLKAFFVAPMEIAPAPPPPPPPAPGRRPTAKVVKAPEPVAPTAFVAPVEMPEEIKPEEGLELGVEGGVAGGVEGGVPGGVVGGVVGGLPAELPPPPPQVVRIGGMVKAPKLVRRVDPVYPELALASRASATVVLEARIDVGGNVKTVRVVRGHPLFDEPAIDAVRQWRYQPLLLNGQPTEFILNVTVAFNLRLSAK
jgi:periplasmic protein TonB